MLLAEAKRKWIRLPRRWVVERSFGRTARFRLLARNYQRLTETLFGLNGVAFAVLMFHEAAPLFRKGFITRQGILIVVDQGWGFGGGNWGLWSRPQGSESLGNNEQFGLRSADFYPLQNLKTVIAIGRRKKCVFLENMDSRTVAQRASFTGNHGVFANILIY